MQGFGVDFGVTCIVARMNGSGNWRIGNSEMDVNLATHTHTQSKMAALTTTQGFRGADALEVGLEKPSRCVQ